MQSSAQLAPLLQSSTNFVALRSTSLVLNMATNQPNIELLRLNKDTTKVAAATNARARSVPISKQATSKASQKQKSTNAKFSHKATNFRQCSNPDIDLEHRKKMRHSNKLLSPEEIEKEQISNPLVQTLLRGQWSYWNRREIQEIKTLDGEEPYRNYLSLPLGLDKDETCVVDFLHYLTIEETSKLSDGESCFTATWSDGTLKCNTPEFERLLFGDKYYHRLGFIDFLPVAIRYETALEQLVGKKNAGVMLAAYFEDVLSILLREENILLAFAAGSSFESFAKLMFKGERTWKKNFEEYHRSHPGKFISASEDPNVYVAPPHHCSCYQPGKQSNMETKLLRSDIFSTSVRRALDPSASPSEFGKEFWSTNSCVFRFLQLAALEGSSHGGQRSWERRKEAVKRYEAGIEPLDDDEKRVQHYLDFMQQSWDVETIYIAAAQILLMNPKADLNKMRSLIMARCPNV